MSSISLRSPGISFRPNRADSEERIICLDLSYSEAIEELDMETLKTRRKGLCTKVFKSIVNDNHLPTSLTYKAFKYLQRG